MAAREVRLGERQGLRFFGRLTSAFCRAACAPERAAGVGQQRAVSRHLPLSPLRLLESALLVGSQPGQRDLWRPPGLRGWTHRL